MQNLKFVNPTFRLLRAPKLSTELSRAFAELGRNNYAALNEVSANSPFRVLGEVWFKTLCHLANDNQFETEQFKDRPVLRSISANSTIVTRVIEIAERHTATNLHLSTDLGIAEFSMLFYYTLQNIAQALCFKLKKQVHPRFRYRLYYRLLN